MYFFEATQSNSEHTNKEIQPYKNHTTNMVTGDNTHVEQLDSNDPVEDKFYSFKNKLFHDNLIRNMEQMKRILEQMKRHQVNRELES